MREEEMGSMVKKKLKSLCCGNGWSYGVFWGFHQPNSVLLTLEDAYYEEQMGAVVDNMLMQVHMLGEGIIGQAAFTGKHQWMFSDIHSGEWTSIGSIGNQHIFQDDSEFHRQFCLGIKTIAVISIESRGVILFGSTQKILERSDFLDQTKSLFREMETVEGNIPLDNAPSSSLNTESYDLNGLFASLLTSGNSNNGNLKAIHGDSSRETIGKACFSTDLTCSFPFISEAPLMLPNKPNYQFQQVFPQSTSLANYSASESPCISTWSTENSTLNSFEPRMSTEMRVQDSPCMVPSKADALVSFRNSVQIFQDPTFTSLCKAGGLFDAEKTIQGSLGKFMDNQHSAPLIHATEGELQERSTSMHLFPEELKAADFTVDFSASLPMCNLSPWAAPLLEHSINGMAVKLADDLSQSIEVSSISSSLVGDDVLIGIPVEHPANSVQSCIINLFTSDGEDKSFKARCAETDLYDGFGFDFGCGIAGECWEDIVMPVVSSGVSECISQLDVNSMAGIRKGLFSELGLKELLDGIGNSNSITKSSFEDQKSATKRRRMESSFSGGGMASMPPLYNLEKTINLAHKKEVLPKSRVGLWIDDSFSVNAGSAVIAQPKKSDEPSKATKKRARPGESTRPRPRDRQQIQDRLKELRGIVPNGHKSSIDSLLDRTIKHLIFLQSVTKYADKLKQTDEPKLIDQGNRSSGIGATWAFEVGDQTMVCPIIVEDLSSPGQMLIEMLCEDRGFLLEIADVVRGFGLNILKGMMEIREDKIWARFIVEANRHVTRLEIFWSLVPLLQQTATSSIDSTNQS